jgi:hypothetical protein
MFYTKKTSAGVGFLIADGIFTGVLVGGAVLWAQAEEEEGLGVVGATVGGGIYVSIGAIGLITTHVVQGIWGPIAATRYNKEVLKTRSKVDPFLASTANSVTSGLTWRF